MHPAEMVDEPTADQRAEHHGDAADHRLNTEAHGMLVCLERGGDDGEGGGQGQGAPRQKKERADKEGEPMMPEEQENVAGERDKAEKNKGASLAPVIGEPAAGISIDRADESGEGVE